jgi:hypothetical protein
MKVTKLKAFTLMEVTISMLLAVIVIGITYTSYDIIIRSYKNYNIKNQQLESLINLNKLLKKDFEDAQVILKTDNGIKMAFNNNQINYQFTNEYIIRSSGVTDTFKFATGQWAASFEKLPIFNLDESNIENNRIDNLKLSVLYNNEIINYHYYKQYSSVNLFQRNSNASN